MTTNILSTTTTSSSALDMEMVYKKTPTVLPMKADEFKRRSYTAYLAYVNFIDGCSGINDTIDAMSPLFSAFGFDLTPENICAVLTVKMTAYGTVQGEKARKVKSISTFRAFIKGGWREVEASPVRFSAGKAPAEKPAKQPRKKAATKKDLEAQIAALEAALEAAGIQH